MVHIYIEHNTNVVHICPEHNTNLVDIYIEHNTNMLNISLEHNTDVVHLCIKFVVNFWDPITCFNSSMKWKLIYYIEPDYNSQGIETVRPTSINNILYDCCV